MNLIRKVHKWLAVIVGIQVIIWVSSGLYLNIADHQKASGKAFFQPLPHYQFQHRDTLFPVSQVLSQIPAAKEVKVISLLGATYYLVTTEKALYPHFVNSYQLVNARTGKWEALNQQQVIDMAKASYTGNGEVAESELIATRPFDFPKQRNPVWRIDFDDELSTSAYIEAGSGRLIGHSNRDKRIADFMLMLHFMDYQKHGSFNSWLIILFAVLTLGLVFTGAIWSVQWLSVYMNRQKVLNEKRIKGKS